MGTNGKTWPVKLAERCRDVGWKVDFTNGNHYKITVTGSNRVFSFAGTPSSPRAEQNALAEAKRYGLIKLEAELSKQWENERLLKIARDRASVPEVQELKVELEKKLDQVDAELDAPVETSSKANLPAIRYSKTRDEIEGHKIVERSPGTLRNAHGNYTAKWVSAVLLDDGRVVHQCNSPRDPGCTAWAEKATSIGSHVRYHKNKDEEVEVAVPANPFTTPGTAPKPPLPPSNGVAAPRSNVNESYALAVGRLGNDLDTLKDHLESANNVVENMLAQVRLLVRLEPTSPEVVEKARRFDELSQTLGNLLKPPS